MQIRKPLRHERQESTCCNTHPTNLCVNELNKNLCFKKPDKDSTSVTKTRKHPRQRMKQKKVPAATDEQKPMRPVWTHFLKILLTEVIFFFELTQDLLKVIQTATPGLLRQYNSPSRVGNPEQSAKTSYAKTSLYTRVCPLDTAKVLVK